MLTKNEINSIQLSATKKDFYQIWGELTEIADKLSERWDISSTNESDPGIVLLKVLTAVADKLNYTVDKNILEAFMPSAAQEESMRKLCAMLGYSMKYYQSAETTVTVKWTGATVKDSSQLALDDGTKISYLQIPQFTVFKNADEDVTYVTKKAVELSYGNLSDEIDVIEGEVVQCESENDNIITVANLDDNNRFYLPESQIAENGIFIYNINDGSVSSELWEKVDNLNTQSLNTKCFKFGYDSQEGLPYIQFPEDIGTIIEDGLTIYFIRTTGVNGNISAGTLSAMNDITISIDGTDKTISADDFSITNKNAATNGANMETISAAYDNYKKTIGTFDTLVTCRDYMNKIYSLYNDNNLPLVSNVIVSDIRDDINSSITTCGFNEYGIAYDTHSLKENDKDLIDHFTLKVYPFKTAYDSGSKKDFEGSFEVSDANYGEIETSIAKYKTLSHILELPKGDDICCIKNFLKIKANIVTTSKVNAVAQKVILSNIYTAIYKEFNLRHLNFGDELLSDSLYEVIQNADSRIKFVSLDDPTVETKIYTRNGTYSSDDTDNSKYHELMNKLILRNVLAGRVQLFNYYDDFKPELSETKATGVDSVIENVTKLQSAAEIGITNLSSNPVTLLDNEVIQFRAPNFKTKKTLSAYVNYYFIYNKTSTDGIAARMKQLSAWLSDNWSNIYPTNVSELTKIDGANSFTTAKNYGYVIVENSGGGLIHTTDASYESGKTYYYWPMNSLTFATWSKKIKAITYTYGTVTTPINYAGIFESKGSDTSRMAGYLIDVNLVKYAEKTYSTSSGTTDLTKLFVQNVNNSKSTLDEASGLGKDSILATIPADSEYQLKDNECLYVNYTTSSTSGNDDGTSSDSTKEVSIYFGEGTIIKPNFALADSETYKTSTGKSWPKTIDTSKQFSPDDGTGANKTLSAGHMWTLGSDEQIEIRAIDQTELKPDDENDTENIFVYWETNDDRDDFFANTDDGEVLLGENEYFFLTDADKSGLVYYGSGTVIKKSGNISLKRLSTPAIDVADVLEYGIEALDSAWLKVQTTKANYITLQSCQFVNLTSGDMLKSISASRKKSAITSLDNNWADCSSAKYSINGAESDLPTIAVASYTWQVRSKLEFNLGPSLTQKLSDKRDYITYFNETTGETGEKLPGNSDKPLCLKANYLCQSSADTINISDLLDEDYTEPFRLSCFNVSDVACTIGTTSEKLTMDNFGSDWTKFSFSQFTKNSSSTDTASIDFNIKLPATTGYYALWMIYYKQADSSKTAYLTIPEPASTTLKIFNNGDSWWPSNENAMMKYYLRDGINVIDIRQNQFITLTNANSEDTFIIGRPDIIKETDEDKGLNLELLQYKSTDSSKSDAEALLAAINAYDPDHEFYYNNVIENSKLININSDLGENLLSPSCWYDSNNVNNKFVICEIDPDYIKTGITITNSSKLK